MKLNKVTDINGRVSYEIEDARMIWTNFAGKEGDYNAEGRRNFNLVLDEQSANELLADGFNVKYKEPKAEGVDPIWTLKVNLNCKGYNPPDVQIKNDHGIRKLDEESVAILDFASIEKCFVRFSPYHFKDNVSAYLQTLLATIHESEYENSFYDEEDSAMNTMTFRAVKPEV